MTDMDDQKRLFRTLAFAGFFLYLGFNIWRAVFNNFAVEEIGVSGGQIGWIQSVREIPGLMGFVLGFLAIWLSEMRVLGLSVLLMGLGLVVSGFADSLSVLMIGTLVMSIGFHFFYPSNSSLVLMGVGKEDAPKWLGRLSSVSALAAALGTLAVMILVDGVQAGPLTIPAWGYRTTLCVAGGIVIVGSLFAMRNGRKYGAQRRRRKVIFRRDYWLYYLLDVHDGQPPPYFYDFCHFHAG